jgi:GH35 family endo-1,4-beta-xylanase
VKIRIIIQLFVICFLFISTELLAQDLQDWGVYENVKNEAVQRIEQHRKGDINLIVKLLNDEIASNTQVRVKLLRHDFKWGAVVSESFETSPYADIHKENFLKYFNASGFNMAMKPKQRGSQAEEIAANRTMPWFLENGIYVRGHTLAWEGERFLRSEDKATYDDASLSDEEKGKRMLESCSVHLPHAIPKWNVKCWDVSNEPIANNCINDLFPDKNTHVHWFKLADSIRKQYGKENVKLIQNDYQIISAITPHALKFTKKGYSAVGRPALYREILDEQLALGAPIEGIGFQSRLKGGLITPDTIYTRLCDFDRFNLPYHVTEFEIRDGGYKKNVYSDEDRKILMEYMMVIYFSHPKVEGFWHWTFADVKSSEVKDYPLFNYDGTPKVTGEKWIELMEGFFNTDEVVTTNSRGEVSISGYYGNYEIITEIDGNTLVGKFEIDKKDNNPTISVNLK